MNGWDDMRLLMYNRWIGTTNQKWFGEIWGNSYGYYVRYSALYSILLVYTVFILLCSIFVHPRKSKKDYSQDSWDEWMEAGFWFYHTDGLQIVQLTQQESNVDGMYLATLLGHDRGNHWQTNNTLAP